MPEVAPDALSGPIAAWLRPMPLRPSQSHAPSHYISRTAVPQVLPHAPLGPITPCLAHNPASSHVAWPCGSALPGLCWNHRFGGSDATQGGLRSGRVQSNREKWRKNCEKIAMPQSNPPKPQGATLLHRVAQNIALQNKTLRKNCGKLRNRRKSQKICKPQSPPPPLYQQAYRGGEN